MTSTKQQLLQIFKYMLELEEYPISNSLRESMGFDIWQRDIKLFGYRLTYLQYINPEYEATNEDS